MVKRFEVWLINLDPTVGAEINKKRPCLIISPDEANKFLLTVIIVPLTSTIREYPTRINCKFNGKSGQLALDQMRSIDKSRLIKKLGILNKSICKQLCILLQILFKY